MGLKFNKNKKNNPNNPFIFTKFNSPKRNHGYIYLRYQDSPQWPSTERRYLPNRPGTLPNLKICGQTDGYRHIISRSEEVSLFNTYIKYGIGHRTYDTFLCIFNSF
ncbi:hypothetical protein EDEG_00858 [Edhazardia aedis USNM 41457]|uniref:Uncharacterized protein n=1 Tax=Edhazardia aedis (strain USNM 41457) TaxID=1003232 RepID=J9DUY6_EDHAE|nr:hypothetical protein EDEG_00858 [Edhazardia aedis USNM 41457]|eukprot:EJW05077.1 hypothetical protein EDEG_00858 [Edhazardia aedis USNM 41457]